MIMMLKKIISDMRYLEIRADAMLMDAQYFFRQIFDTTSSKFTRRRMRRNILAIEKMREENN